MVSIVFELNLAVDVLIFSVEDVLGCFVDADFEPPLRRQLLNVIQVGLELFFEEFEIVVSGSSYYIIGEHSQCAQVCFDFAYIVEKYVE